MSERESLWQSLDHEEAQQRMDAAVSRISRVQARLQLLSAMPDEPDFPTECRLLIEALDLLNPEVHLV